MAIIDQALVLSDGAGHTNVLDMSCNPDVGTTGGHNNVSGWVNVRTTGTQGSVKIQQSRDNGVNDAYSDVAGGTATFAAAGHTAFPLPKTTERYIKVVFTSASGDNLSASNTCVWVGGLSEAKELA